MELSRVDATPAALADAAGPYFAAFSQPPYNETEEQLAELHERLQRYSSRDGFRLALATDEGAPVGMALSVNAARGDWWRDRAASALPADIAEEWFGGVIREVVHVAVAPARQRRGVGRRLVADALDDPGADAVVLSCRPDAEPARRLYLSCGFQVLTRDFTTAPGQMPYWLMARRPSR